MMPDSPTILEARGLTKRFGDFEAVKGVDLEVRAGEIYGFLGPNGAGKTTTIRMLSTLLNCTGGSIVVDGHPIPKDQRAAREIIGIAQQHNGLDRDITARENIIHHAILHKMPKKEYMAVMDELVDIFGLEPHLDKLISDLSGGWKKKVAIVGSMIHSPRILFLDEPTTGLDIKSRLLLWDIIKKLNARGTTIFLTTHYIEEAEALCDRISIIDGGRIIRTGTPEDLCNETGRVTIEENTDTYHRLTHFNTREEGKEYMATLEYPETAYLRKTRLEDAYLYFTDRGDAP
ncbi:MAG: ABC transporter ATP-binding protein [Candidatus Methanomethylophilaceae archaeon]